MAILENDARFMKVTGILILLLLVLVTGLLVALRLQLWQGVLRQGVWPETLSREVSPSSQPSPAKASPEVTPGTASAPITPPARKTSRPSAASSHYMREEAKTPLPKEELAAPYVAPLAASSESLPFFSTTHPAPPASPAPKPKWVETTVPAGAVVTVLAGAAIGAIAGGCRGAGSGAATGAGASTAQVLLSRGKPVVLIPETRLSFQLRAILPLTVSAPEATMQTSRFLPNSLAVDSDIR